MAGLGVEVAGTKRMPRSCIRVGGAAAAAGRGWLPEKVGCSGKIKDCRALQKRWSAGAAKSGRVGGVMLVGGGCRGWGGGTGSYTHLTMTTHLRGECVCGSDSSTERDSLLEQASRRGKIIYLRTLHISW